MNRHFDPEDENVTVSLSKTGVNRDFAARSVCKEASASLNYIKTLRGIIRTRVFPRTRKQLTEKRIMQIERPDFSSKVIDTFLQCLLGTEKSFNRPRARYCIDQVGGTVLEKALFLEASAREMGKRWTADSCDFIETSIVASRLQMLVHELEKEIPFIPQGRTSPTALIACPETEHHTLMSEILGLLFRSVGWQKKVITGDLRPAISEIRATSKVDIACVAWSNDLLIDDVRQLVSKLMSLPDDLRPVVIVGGPAAEKHVNEMLMVGVDCICDSVYAAVNISERYISLRNSHHKLQEARRFLNSSIHLDDRLNE